MLFEKFFENKALKSLRGFDNSFFSSYNYQLNGFEKLFYKFSYFVFLIIAVGSVFQYTLGLFVDKYADKYLNPYYETFNGWIDMWAVLLLFGLPISLYFYKRTGLKFLKVDIATRLICCSLWFVLHALVYIDMVQKKSGITFKKVGEIFGF